MPHQILNNLGMNVRNLRRAKGFSQEKFAELTGLHRTYIGGVERGERNISVLNLAKIAEALEVSLIDLVRDIEHYLTNEIRCHTYLLNDTYSIHFLRDMSRLGETIFLRHL